MDDIRLVYIGTAHKALSYAKGHLPEPAPRHDQIIVARTVKDLEGLILPPWCHIATELHVTKDGAVPNVAGANIVFEAALARRRNFGKAGA